MEEDPRHWDEEISRGEMGEGKSPIKRIPRKKEKLST